MFSDSLNSNSDIIIVMIVAVKLTQSSRDSVSRQPAKRMETRSARCYFHCLRRTMTRITDKVTVLDVLLQSLASIPQIYQSIFQIYRAEIASHSTKQQHKPKLFNRSIVMCFAEKVPRCVSDVRIEVSCRRDLNTDVSVLVRLIDKSSDSDSHHAGVSL